MLYYFQEVNMRFFTTEGPVNCVDHYCLPPLTRFDLDDVLALIGQKKYSGSNIFCGWCSSLLKKWKSAGYEASYHDS